VKVSTRFYPVPRLRIVELYLHSPIRHRGSVADGIGREGRGSVKGKGIEGYGARIKVK
jgi:hypothetical protein